MDRAAFARNTLRDFVSHLGLGITDDDIVIRGEESVGDFPLGCEGFSTAGGTQNQAVRVFELFAVHHDEVVGEGVQAVVERAEAEKFSSHLLLQSEQGKMAGNVAGQQKSSKSFSDLLLSLALLYCGRLLMGIDEL